MIFGVVGGNGVQTTILEHLESLGHKPKWHIKAKENIRNTNIDKEIDVVLVLVDNVGHYLHDFAKTFAKKHGIEFRTGSIQWAKTHEGLKVMFEKEKIFKDKMLASYGRNYITKNEAVSLFYSLNYQKVHDLILKGSLKFEELKVSGHTPWKMIAVEDLQKLGYTLRDKNKFSVVKSDVIHNTTDQQIGFIKIDNPAEFLATQEIKIVETDKKEETSTITVTITETVAPVIIQDQKTPAEQSYAETGANTNKHGCTVPINDIPIIQVPVQIKKEQYSVFISYEIDGKQVKEFAFEAENGDLSAMIEMHADELFEKTKAKDVKYHVFAKVETLKVKRAIKIERE